MAKDGRRSSLSGAPKPEDGPQASPPPVIEGQATEINDAGPEAPPTPDAPEPDRPDLVPPTEGDPVTDPTTPLQGEASGADGSEAEPHEPSRSSAPFAGTTARPHDEASHRPSEAPNLRTVGLLSALVAAIVVLVLGGLAYMLFGQGDSQRQADLDATVAQLKSKIAALEARPQAPIAAIDALGKRLDEADQKRVALDTAVAALTKRVGPEAAAAKPVAAPAPVAVTPDLQPAVTALNGKVDDLGKGLTALRTTVDNDKPDFGPVNGKIAALDQHLTALQKTVDGIPRIDLAPVMAKLDALDARVKPLETLDGRIKPLEAALQESRSPQRVAVARAAPVAVTAQAVLRAVEVGHPFADDLKALGNLGADAQTLEPLKPVAANGAPTIDDLRSELAGLRDKMLGEAAPKASGSYLDRIMAGATSMVQVRPLGSTVGDTPGAILARMDASLASDDLAATLADWRKLPDPAREVSKGLADRIRLRLAAETAARTIAAHAIGAMGAAVE